MTEPRTILRRLKVKEQVSSEKETSQGFLANRVQTLGRAVLGLPSTTHMYVHLRARTFMHVHAARAVIARRICRLKRRQLPANCSGKSPDSVPDTCDVNLDAVAMHLIRQCRPHDNPADGTSRLGAEHLGHLKCGERH